MNQNRYTKMSSNPFHYLNSITQTKKDIMYGEAEEKQYSPFMSNRGLSYYHDTVLLANEMNRASHIDNRMQYDFLRTAIRARKRFSKWHKKTKVDDVDTIKQYYGYSDAKAESVADLFTEEDIKHMKGVLSVGGKKTK
jgi:hypothetical protein